MKEKLRVKARRIADSPKTRQVVNNIKPTRSVWGFLGVVFFFIVPEIIAFAWGTQIADDARHRLLLMPQAPASTWYRMLVFMFEDGGSFINLAIGIVLLVWLFF